MKRVIEDTDGTIELDSEQDPCLYASPECGDGEEGAYMRGRALHVFEMDGQPLIYYIYRWSKHAGEVDSINIVTEKNAERFLEVRGFVLNMSGEEKAAAALRNYGYGVIEEF